MTMDENDPDTPSLQQQTIALGQILNAQADNDPGGTPGESAASVFADWLAAAGPGSREPGYFADVRGNYEVRENSNRDLWDLFDILENYIEVEEDEAELNSPPRTFIGLPLAP